MTVELTSPALGKSVGDTHTGPEEPWLLANGYAKQAGYTGPGVASTGPAAHTVAQDLTVAANREQPGDAYDFDAGGDDTEAPVLDSGTVDPKSGAVAGGTAVTITGDQFTDATSVTFGGTAATSFEVVDDNTIEAVTPAHAAGAVNVVVTDPNGADTLVGGYTYA